MISVIIPTYKNKPQLLTNLSHNMKHLSECEVIVVNDNPEEDLTNDLAKYKNTILIQNEKNSGFGRSINRGVRRAKNNYVVLLNSDVLLHNQSFKEGVVHFQSNPKLFAVSFGQREKDRSIVGKNRIFWKFGMFRHEKAKNLDLGYNGWAEGGSCMIDRRMFEKLTGFSELFSPFYWEDIDLSYRAWKQGYQIQFDPDIEVEHHHESTIGKYYGRSHIKVISYRNQFIFMWKNISDLSLVISHLFLLIPNMIYFLTHGEFIFFKGFLLALFKLPVILSSKATSKTNLSDREVLQQFI